jgi:cysteine desulfurase/selenocysteine lyase
LERIHAYENHLLQYATKAVGAVKGVRIIGTAPKKVATISFVIEEPFISLLDISEALNQEGIATRIGHHCCMPLMHELGIAGTCRASLAFYNTEHEVDRLVDVLKQMIDKRLVQLKGSSAASKSDGATQGLEEIFAKHSSGVAAESIEQVAEKLEEEFDLVDTELEKNTILNELGQKLPRTFTHLKVHTPAVSGCMSEVYLAGRPIASQPDRIEFVGDSNNDLVRGLIALLQHLFSGQRAEIFGPSIWRHLFGKLAWINSSRYNAAMGWLGWRNGSMLLPKKCSKKRMPKAERIVATALQWGLAASIMIMVMWRHWLRRVCRFNLKFVENNVVKFLS